MQHFLFYFNKMSQGQCLFALNLNNASGKTKILNSFSSVSGKPLRIEFRCDIIVILMT
jgi:hypothetical protein